MVLHYEVAGGLIVPMVDLALMCIVKYSAGSPAVRLLTGKADYRYKTLENTLKNPCDNEHYKTLEKPLQ